MLKSTSFSIFLFLGSLILFTVGLSHHEFTQFETRFAYFAQQINQYGVSFFPVLYGKAYPDYPVTYPLVINLFFLIFRKITLFVAVLPSAIQAAGTVVLTYRLGAFHRMSWGIAAVLFEFATFYFLMTARSLSLDQFVVFATTLSFYLVYFDDVKQENKYDYRKWLPLVFIYGFIFRGPMGMIIPLSVVVVTDVLAKQYKKCLKTFLMGAILFLILTAVLLFFAYHQGGESFVWQVLDMQGLSRIKQLGHYPFYYYFQHVFVEYAVAFPIAVCVVCCLYKKIMTRQPTFDMQFIQYLLGWIAIILMGMSIPSGKKLRYILPIVPAVSLIAGYLIIDNTSWVLSQIRRVFLSFCFYFPFIALLLVGFVEFFSLYKEMVLGANYIPTIICLAVIFIVGNQSLTFWIEKTAQYNLKLAMGVSAWLVLVIFMIQPMHVYFNRTLPFAATIQPQKKLIFYKIGPDAEDVKLMLVLQRQDAPTFISNENELNALDPSSVIIMKKKDYRSLSDEIKNHFFVVSHGKIGHQCCMAVSLKKTTASEMQGCFSEVKSQVSTVPLCKKGKNE